MSHEAELIATIAVGLTAAFLFALVAVRLRLPPIVGYLLAGVAVVPFTPGFVADTHLAPQLAEIGVLLLRGGMTIALVVAAALAQIGEFSFILATLGLSLNLLPEEGYNLILAGPLVSIITLNPLLFHVVLMAQARLDRRVEPTAPALAVESSTIRHD